MTFSKKTTSVLLALCSFCMSFLFVSGSRGEAALPTSHDADQIVLASSAKTSPSAALPLERTELPYRLFPAMLNPEIAAAAYSSVYPQRIYGPEALQTEKTQAALRDKTRERQPILANNQIVAFYGKPGASSMGILGEYTKEQLAPLLEAYAKLYDDCNGAMGVVPALYIIYGTCWPGGDIGILSKNITIAYIEFALARGWPVFLDHQIGKYDVLEAVNAMLPFLSYPNVHLAIDPEWRTTMPMKEIGSIDASEVNASQELINKYLVENKLPGIRMFVVHQFKTRMIRNAAMVRADYDRVVLIHTADGFGSPNLKRLTYAYNARYSNMPVKGFKLFFESKVPGAGWDVPLMTPPDVMALDPMPLVVMYQ